METARQQRETEKTQKLTKSSVCNATEYIGIHSTLSMSLNTVWFCRDPQCAEV